MSEDSNTEVKQNSWHHSCARGLHRNVCSFTWTIENYSFMNQKPCASVDSDGFSCCESSECKWYVRLYPNGVLYPNGNTEKYISVYLYNSSLNDAPVYTNYVIFLKNDSNKTVWKNQDNSNFKKEESWGWKKAIKCDEQKQQLRNDILKIHVDLTVFVNGKQEFLKNTNVKFMNYSTTNASFQKCTLTWKVENPHIVSKLPQKSLSSDVFYEKEDSELKWRLVLKAESNNKDIIISKIMIGLIAQKKPLDIHYPVQYKIVVKTTENAVFNKIFSDKRVVNVDGNWQVIGEEKDLLDIFANGALQLQADVLVATGTVNVRNFTTMSHQDHKSAEYFSKMLEHGKYSDFSIFVKGKKIAAHKAILAARSPIFDIMLQHDVLGKHKRIIEIDDLSYEIMMYVLRFMYTNQFTAEDDESVFKVLKASDKYQMDDLKKLCEDYLICNMNTFNAKVILSCAETYQSSKLKDEALKFMNFFVDDFILFFNDLTVCNTDESAKA